MISQPEDFWGGPISQVGKESIYQWLLESDPSRLEQLWRAADVCRRVHVGDDIHLRGLIEISNYCVRRCTYCGIRSENRNIERYRMTEEEIVGRLRFVRDFGCGTVVLQSGEDYGLTRDIVTRIIRRVKDETPLAVTLSLGERSYDELAAWREAGADRYLLRFETSDAGLYARIHPQRAGQTDNRFVQLAQLRSLGYEVGSGIMVGIPGQTWDVLAEDILTFRRYDFDMIGIGPYIANPDTPLGRYGQSDAGLEQVPAAELTVLKTLALTRLLCPDANLPATTALGTINPRDGRTHGLERGANVIMPNFTPTPYRQRYQIYPDKASIDITTPDGAAAFHASIHALGRSVGKGAGGRRR